MHSLQKWRISSYCDNSTCIQIHAEENGIQVRDSSTGDQIKDLPDDRFSQFIRAIKADRFTAQ